MGTFAVAGIHVKPDDAVSEIDLLADVYDYIDNQLGDDVSIVVSRLVNLFKNLSLFFIKLIYAIVNCTFVYLRTQFYNKKEIFSQFSNFDYDI